MTTKVNPVPSGYHTITPSLTFKSSSKALEFYQSAFGAQILNHLPSPEGGRTMHATMQIGNSILMMGDEIQSENCSKSAETLGASPISLYVYVPNVDQAFEQAVGVGATVTMPVMDMFWGDRCGGVKDPFGYTWIIATHIKDLTEDEIKKGAQDFCANSTKK